MRAVIEAKQRNPRVSNRRMSNESEHIADQCLIAVITVHDVNRQDKVNIEYRQFDVILISFLNHTPICEWNVH